MKAEIVSIGNEILLGDVLDTNSHYIAGRLPLIGIDLHWISQVGDDRLRLLEVLQCAWARSELVIVNGGLGPTEDDITRQTIAELFAEDMYIDEGLKQWLEQMFSKMGYRMPEENIKQAMLISSARVIPNPLGSAPGWRIERDSKTMLAIPGPPAEMRRMWNKEIEPELKKRMNKVIISRTLKTFGLGESELDERLGSLVSALNPTIGVYTKADGVQVRITARASRQEEAHRILTDMEAEVRAILGPYIWGEDEDTLDAIIVTLLQERDLSLGVMESPTGGLLTSTVSDVPESINCLRGGLVAYSDEMKISCGVNAGTIQQYGAASAEVTVEMAELARSRFKADIGLGLDCVREPDASGDIKAGTIFVTIASAKETKSHQAYYPPRRADFKAGAAFVALFTLHQFLTSLQQ